MLSLGGSFEFLNEAYPVQTGVPGLSVDENFVIIACVIVIQYKRMRKAGIDTPKMNPGQKATWTKDQVGLIKYIPAEYRSNDVGMLSTVSKTKHKT